MDISVEERKQLDKQEKERLIRMITVYQTRTIYTPEALAGKSLKRLREIYDETVHR